MGTRNFLQTTPTAASIALNAGMYGFAEHSMVTPHNAVKQLWWTDERISAQVTRKYVVKHIRGTEREFLDKTIGFGDDLTDDTYMDWILNRAQRLFLILSHINCADRIFSLIDDSWQDEDLPVPRSDVKRLELALDNNEKLNRKFYDTQFHYLLRQPERGEHIEYGPCEHIPMEYVFSMPPAVQISMWHRIHFPDQPEKTFVRRRFEFSDEIGSSAHKLAFLEDVAKARTFRHEHIAPVWASYTADESGYILTDFIGEHTLRTFMDHRTPPQYTRLPEDQRPALLLEWMHCLADAVAYLHHRGEYHGSIRPSNILIDEDNVIALSDVGHLKTFIRDKSAPKEEVREYTPPEHQPVQSPKTKLISNPFNVQKNGSSLSVSVSTFSPKLNHASTFSCGTAISASSTPRSPTSPTTRNFSRHLHIPPRKDSAHEMDPSSPASKTSSILPTPPTTPTSPSFSPPTDFGTILSRVNSSSTISRVSSRAQNHHTEASIPPHLFDSPSNNTSPRRPSAPTHSATSPRLTSLLSINTTTPIPSILYNPSPVAPPDVPATPQQSDVFSLGCIFLDILTFLIQGKLTHFLKARRKDTASPPPSNAGVASPGGGFGPSSDTASLASRKTSVSTAFSALSLSPSHTTTTTTTTTRDHSLSSPRDADAQLPLSCSERRLDAWLDTLRLAAMQHNPVLDLYPATAALAALIRRMLDRDSGVRPGAAEARDAVGEVLERVCGMEGICCKGREGGWDGDAAVGSGSRTRGGMGKGEGERDWVREVQVQRGLRDAIEAERRRVKVVLEERGEGAVGLGSGDSKRAGSGGENGNGGAGNASSAGVQVEVDGRAVVMPGSGYTAAEPGPSDASGAIGDDLGKMSSFSDDSGEGSKNRIVKLAGWKLPKMRNPWRGPIMKMP